MHYKKNRFFFTLSLSVALFLTSFHTYSNSSLQYNISEYIDAIKLYDKITWLKLLHYKKKATSTYQSEIVTPSFFLSEIGKTSPKKELIANINAFLKATNHGYKADEHPQCRFPARYKWIAAQLEGINVDFPQIDCPKYRQWIEESRVESISLIYASGFFENPASFYGHLLVKLNNDADQQNLLATSVNYGARVPSEENIVAYITKGIFGGYDARFSYNYYYKNVNVYSQIEMRDMWEYRLNLKPSEVGMIADHIWELLHHDFTYFFTKENCAYRIAELIELPLSKGIINKNKPWVLPIEVVKGVYNHDGLLDAHTYIPSKRTNFVNKYLASSEREKRYIKGFIDEDKEAQSRYEYLNNLSKSKTIDTLFDYYASMYVGDYENSKYQRTRQRLLKQQLKLPPVRINQPASKKDAPHKGQNPSLLQTTAFYNEQLKEGLHLRLRPAYYDFLSRDVGRHKYSSLSMFDLQVSFIDEELAFHSLDLLKIDNLHVTETDISSLSDYSWNIRTGFEPKNMSCINCTVSFIEGGLGKAYSLGENYAAYGFIEARAQSRTCKLLSGTPKIGLIGKVLEGWHSHVSLGYRQYLDHAEDSDLIAVFENRFGNNEDWDIRLTFQKHIASETSISLNYYW